MENSNKKKDDLLGMPHGTASHQLRKMIMFQMIQELKRDICFRCGEKIENIEDLSIEHMDAWQQAKNPKESFFNLKNISFSHLNCNIAVGKKMERQPTIHGRRTGYKHGCKCEECKKAESLHMKKLRKKWNGRHAS